MNNMNHRNQSIKTIKMIIITKMMKLIKMIMVIKMIKVINKIKIFKQITQSLLITLYHNCTYQNDCKPDS